VGGLLLYGLYELFGWLDHAHNTPNPLLVVGEKWTQPFIYSKIMTKWDKIGPQPKYWFNILQGITSMQYI
jgi:hypothetical protein